MKKLFLLFILGIFLITFANAFDWNNGTISYYKLDETTGTIAIDQKNNNGTNSGATINISGKINTAYNYSNSGRVTQTNDVDWTILTISAWYKPTSYPVGSEDYIVSKTDASVSSNSNIEYELMLSSTILQCNTRNATGQINIVSALIGNLTLNAWNHILCIQDENNDVARLYINGLSISNNTAATGIHNNLTSKFVLGARGDNYGYLEGSLDEVGFWNRSLSASEVLEIYNSGNGLPYGSSQGEAVSLSLLSPSNGATLSTDGTNFTVGGTIGSANLNWTNVTYYIWNINGSLFNQTTTPTVNSNITNTSLFIDYFVLGQNYLWNANGCYGNSTYSNCTWSSNGNFTYFNLPFNNASISYIPSVLETDYQTYNLTIQANPSVSSVVGYFWYDGTRYSSTPISNGGGSYTFRNSLDVPLQQSSGNKSFLWQFTFTLTDNSVVHSNSTTYSQQVNRTILQICNGTYATKFINFTTKSATNPFPLVNGTFKSAWNWYVSTGHGTVTRNYTYEELSNTLSNWNFCGSLNVSFITDVEVEYDSNGYALNFYYINGATLTNSTNNITLYLLNDSLATTTVLKVVDSSQQPLEDYTIQIQFYDVGTGTFYTVANAKTDYKGEDVVYLNWYDSLYKFAVLDENLNVVKTTGTTKITSSPTVIEILETQEFVYDKFENFVYTLYYENSTSNFVLTYTKPSGEVDQACLRVYKETATNSTLICNQCETSSSATLFCNIGSYGNGTYVASFYATGSLKLIDWIFQYIGGTFQEEIYELLGNEDASFYAFLIAVLVTVALFINAVFGVIALVIGLIIASALGFTGIQWGQMMGIIAIAGGILWFLRR